MPFTRKDIEDLVRVLEQISSFTGNDVSSTEKTHIDALEYLMSKAGGVAVVSANTNYTAINTVTPASANANKLAYSQNDETIGSITYKSGWYFSNGTTWNYTPIRVSFHSNPTLAPTVNDDVTNGHFNGDLWRKIDTNDYYILANNTDGSALWISLTEGMGSKKRTFSITGNIPANTNINITAASGTNWTASGDVLDFIGLATFNKDSKVIFYVNGEYGQKGGVVVDYVNTTTFKLPNLELDNTDTITILTT
jgi:hypothetical protein